MPGKEEEAPANLTDMVAKESSESTASTHPMHQEGDKETKSIATLQDHKANPGPVMAENLGQPADKEELRAKAREMNDEAKH